MLLNNQQNFVGMQLHVGDAYEIDYTARRYNFYNGTGVPDAWFDGVENCHGAYTNDTQMYNWYLGKINLRRAVATDLNIKLEGVEVAPQTYNINATLTVDPGGVERDVTVHMVQLLDYYPSSTDNRYRNCVMDDAPLQVVHVSPSTPKTITSQFVIEGVSWTNRQNVKIACWARQTGSPGPKEIYQGAQLVWPIAVVPGDVNGDGMVDLSDLGALLASYNKCEGDPGYNPDCDLDDDNCVGLSDLAILLANYGYGT